jgi:hypothetical protein
MVVPAMKVKDFNFTEVTKVLSTAVSRQPSAIRKGDEERTILAGCSNMEITDGK